MISLLVNSTLFFRNISITSSVNNTHTHTPPSERSGKPIAYFSFLGRWFFFSSADFRTWLWNIIWKSYKISSWAHHLLPWTCECQCFLMETRNVFLQFLFRRFLRTLSKYEYLWLYELTQKTYKTITITWVKIFLFSHLEICTVVLIVL